MRFCAGFLMVLGVVCLVFHLESGGLLVIVGAFLLVLDEKQREQKSSK